MRLELSPKLDVPMPPAPGERSLSCSLEVRQVLASALKKSVHNRYTVAALMSELTGEQITKAQLDAWTGESKTKWRFPFEYAAAFESACGVDCTELQELLGRKRGSRILVGSDVLYAELGRICELHDLLGAREKEIKNYLREKKT